MEPVAERHRRFYNQADCNRYGRQDLPLEATALRSIMEAHGIGSDAVVLELGCGAGALSDIHPGYIGLDLSHWALKIYLDGYSVICASMEEIPLKGESVDMVFSVSALEHTPRPERVLAEMERVIKPGGIVYLAPAWHCRPWIARGLHRRPVRELKWKEKVEKLTIPIRDSLPVRATRAFPIRLLDELQWWLFRKPLCFHYQRLQPNLDHYLDADSDAFSSMDPHTVLMYFLSRGWQAVPRSTLLRRLLIRHEAVVFRAPWWAETAPTMVNTIRNA